jgi:hypothetical protein
MDRAHGEKVKAQAAAKAKQKAAAARTKASSPPALLRSHHDAPVASIQPEEGRCR